MEVVCVPDMTVLHRPVFTVPEAARQLDTPPSTVRRWLDGGRRRGTFYQPVIRSEPTGDTAVTWGEFVELRYLRAYRRLDVRLQQLREVIAGLRREFDSPYPLAHFRPYVSEGRRLVLSLQRDADLPDDLSIVYELAGGQTVLAAPAEAFLSQVEFTHGDDPWAARLFPAGRGSPVVMDPEVAFGAPSVRGIRTDVLRELVDADEPLESVAEDFGIDLGVLKAAVSYEWSRAS